MGVEGREDGCGGEVGWVWMRGGRMSVEGEVRKMREM